MSLEEVVERLNWAEQHWRSLDLELHAAWKSYRVPPLTEDREEGGRVRKYSISHLPALPEDVGLKLGDSLHNFRAVLDNLAYTMAEENTPGGLSSDDRKAVSFPIAIQESDFRDVVSKGVIRKMPDAAQAAIDGLRPYHSEQRADRHPLAVLRKLSDLDKHRTIPVVRWTVSPVVIDPEPLGTKRDFPSDKLEENTEFMRLMLPRKHAKVDIHVVCRVIPIVQEPVALRGRDIGLWMDAIDRFIRDSVLKPLAQYCPQARPETVADLCGLVYRAPSATIRPPGHM
jgi:hypothetical protein